MFYYLANLQMKKKKKKELTGPCGKELKHAPLVIIGNCFVANEQIKIA